MRTKLFALSTALLVSTATYADDLDRRVLVINESDATITSFQAINVDRYGDWYTYIEQLGPGGSAEVNIGDEWGYCRYDILADFSNGGRAYYQDINVCEEYEIYVSENMRG